jgi:hypothetical protein
MYQARAFTFIPTMSKFAASTPSRNDNIETCCKFETFLSPLHGNGVRISDSNAPIMKDFILLKERPLQAMQTLTNKHDVLVCSDCLKALGSIDFQVQYLTKKVTRVDVINRSYDCNDSYIVPCNYGCGECYCCHDCKTNHWLKSHQLLCTGRVPEEEGGSSPLIAFKTFAVETNEIFLLCGEIFASICLSIESNVQNGMPLSGAIDLGLLPYEGYVRNLWWDAAVAPAGTNPKTLVKSLKELVSDAWSLLCETLKLRDRGLDKVLSLEYLSRTIGMFEQNNVGIRVQTPLSRSIQGLDHSDEDAIKYFESVTRSVIDQINCKLTISEFLFSPFLSYSTICNHERNGI